MPDQYLVQRVKDWQRTSKGHNLGWDKFCREAGRSRKDPGAQDDDFLQQFLDAADTGMISTDYEEDGKGKGKDGDGEPSEDLVSLVKDWQRISKGHSQGWDRFCVENGHSRKDPKSKSNEFLQRFLDATDEGTVSTDYDEDYDAKAKGSAAHGEGDLVERVKEWQRRSKGHKLSWDRYVREVGGDKSLDPKAKSTDFLQRFLKMTEMGMISTNEEEEWNARSSGKGKDGMKGGDGKGGKHGIDGRGTDPADAWNPDDGDREAMLGYLSQGMAKMVDVGQNRFGMGFMKLVETQGVGKSLRSLGVRVRLLDRSLDALDFRESSGGKGYDDYPQPGGVNGWPPRKGSGGKDYDDFEGNGWPPAKGKGKASDFRGGLGKGARSAPY